MEEMNGTLWDSWMIIMESMRDIEEEDEVEQKEKFFKLKEIKRKPP